MCARQNRRNAAGGSASAVTRWRFLVSLSQVCNAVMRGEESARSALPLPLRELKDRRMVGGRALADLGSDGLTQNEMDAACKRTVSCGRPTSSSASTWGASGASLKSPTIGAARSCGVKSRSLTGELVPAPPGARFCIVAREREREEEREGERTLQDVGEVNAQLVFTSANKRFESEQAVPRLNGLRSESAPGLSCRAARGAVDQLPRDEPRENDSRRTRRTPTESTRRGCRFRHRRARLGVRGRHRS